MPKVRSTLANFAQESERLRNALHADAGRLPGGRRSMGSAFRVSASASALAQTAAETNQLEPLVEDVRALDRDWRLLSYRLRQVEGLSDTCRRSAQKLDQYDKELCSLFKIQPQIDYRELLRAADTLAIDLRRLIEDTEIELGKTRKCQELLVEGRRVEHQARYLADAIQEERPYDAVAAEFKKFHTLWQPFAAKLWPLNNRYVERDMRRIEEIDREMHGLLWLPRPIDHRHLQHLTEVLTARVDDLFDKVTLNLLIELPGTENVLNTASEFYGVCQQFAEEARAKSPPEDLRHEFQWIEEAWPGLADCFRSAKKPEIVNLLNEIEQTFLSMRDALYVETAFDSRVIIELAARLDGLTEHLELDFRRTVGSSSRYHPSFRVPALKACSEMKTAAHQFHQNLASGRPLPELRNECDALSRRWAQFCEKYVAKLQTQEQIYLGRQISRITSTVVELQTMFE